MAEPIKMQFEILTRVGPGNHVLDGGPDAPTSEQLWGGKETTPGHCWTCLTVKRHRGGRANTVLMPVGCIRWGTHCRNVVNMIEPSVCSGNAALFQITLTTCLHKCCYICNITRVVKKVKEHRADWKISLNISAECLQCFDAVGWVAGRASGL